MPVRPRRVSAYAALLALSVLASLIVVVPAGASDTPVQSHPWLERAVDPGAVADAIAANPEKLPKEFFQRLKWTLPDGTLRVMVALADRNTAIEDFVGDNTTWVQWYGDAPRFLGRVTQDQMATLLNTDVITFVEPDYPITNFMSTSTLDVHARSLAADGTGVWSYSAGPNGGSLVSDVPGLSVDQATGKGVTVAITDSGIDKTHRDFGGWNCAAGPFQPCQSRIRAAITIDHIVGAGAEPGPAMPTTEAASGHGTHVAGTIAGNAYYSRFRSAPDAATYAPDGHNFGIAPQASLISTKNGDSQSAGLSTFGLQWQLDNAEELDIRVSSNSWGCPGGCSFNGNSAMARLLKDMYGAGIVVVFAAGNDGAGSDGLSNAQSPYALGVANYDDGNHRLASSSSRGTDNTLPTASTWTPESEPVNGEPRPDVGAPGTAIWSARTLTGGTSAGAGRVNVGDLATGSSGGTREYVQMTGTSMSTPHVAGAAALLFSACPTATPLDVMRAVMAGADPTEILKTSGTQTAQPSEIGYGSLEIRRSVDWLRGQTVCGGSGGGGTEPTPTPTTEPTTDPTTDPTTEPTQPPVQQEATKFYLHSGSGNGNIDYLSGDATFDTTAPTADAPASWYDNGLLINDGAFDPAFTGTIGKEINGLEIDIWQWSPVARAQGRLDYEAAIMVGDTIYRLPPAEQDAEAAITNQVTRFTARWTTMLDGQAEVPLSIDPGTEPVTVFIRGSYLDVETVSELWYDAVEFPSSFTVFTGGTVDPTPTETVEPTPDPTVSTAPTPPPPPPGGDRGTYPNPPNDPYYGTPGGPTSFDPEQWGLYKVRAADAWQEPRATGHEVRVAVLDSGVDLQHEDLKCPGKIDVTAGSDVVAKDSDPDDENGHGTHVAGIIGACTNNRLGVAGVAPDATLVPIRVLNAAGSGTDAQLVAGLDKAREAGVHVINMSLGYIPGKEIINNVAAIDAAIARAQADGIVVVAAAGNDSSPLCDYPALAEDIICVGATDPRDLKAAYSTFPNKFDNEDGIGPGLVAPGGSGQPVFCDTYSENILSTVPLEKDTDGCTDVQGYQRNFGSSMASPHVAGVAALVYDRLGAVRSDENRKTVVNAIVDTAADLGTPGYDPVFGHGRVDALAAVRSVEAVVTPTAAATEVTFTNDTAEGAQHSDDARIAARLVNSSTDEPIAGQELVFELVGVGGSRTWTATTGGDGVAGGPVAITDAPDTYTLNVRFAEVEGTYLGSADVATFVVDKDDSATTLAASGGRNDRQLTSTTTDADSGLGLAGVPVTFFADGVEIATATTGDNGTATVDVPKKETKKNTNYEVRFGGTDTYLPSSANQRV